MGNIIYLFLSLKLLTINTIIIIQLAVIIIVLVSSFSVLRVGFCDLRSLKWMICIFGTLMIELFWGAQLSLLVFKDHTEQNEIFVVPLYSDHNCF